MFLSRDPSKKPFPISDQIWKKNRKNSTIIHHRLRLLGLLSSSLLRKMETLNKNKTSCQYGTGLLFRTPHPISDAMSMIAGIKLKLNNCNYNCRENATGILNGRGNCFFPTLPPAYLTSPHVDASEISSDFPFSTMSQSLQKIFEREKFHWQSQQSLTDLGTKDLLTAIGPGFLTPMDPLETPPTNDSRISSRMFLTVSAWDK